ncbi:hypothetical protein M0R45_007491 [Rubus argutus]|uniref:Reverse transcriptase zinc-binding domain-containing protein n=1 Tax=Rubus argutus TaxID=59490 RepID=A0AAW1XYX5_RUBAR
MNRFCELSGQNVNFEKSKLYCSPNTNRNLAKEISSICGSPLTHDLGKYLGMPLIHSRISKQTYAEVIDKVQNRLAGWKSKTLNMAGRLTLIQAVTSSTPVYAMQTAKLPSCTTKTLDKLNRDFLWGDCDGKKKIHLVKWESVCKPKWLGGLGIKKAATMNQAMLAKTSWRMLQKDEGLWSEVFRSKYLRKDNLLADSYKKPTSCSSTWSSVCYGASILRKGLKWRIGDGASAHFWTNKWSDAGILGNHALDSSMIDNDMLVQDFWNNNEWDRILLYACLPPEIVEQIISIPISISGHEDRLIWNHSTNGQFSVKSAYLSTLEVNIGLSQSWKLIWSLKIPPKLKMFTWLLFQGRLLTNVNRVKRNLTQNPCCPHCAGTPETMTHLFRDCPKARAIWIAIGRPTTMQRTDRLDWEAWITANIFQKNCKFMDFDWSHLFLFVCWYIWKWRNKSILISTSRVR